MRGRRGRRHEAPVCTYVGRFVVEKNPSGRTPSAGAGSKRASRAPARGGASEFGGRSWNPGRAVAGGEGSMRGAEGAMRKEGLALDQRTPLHYGVRVPPSAFRVP